MCAEWHKSCAFYSCSKRIFNGFFTRRTVMQRQTLHSIIAVLFILSGAAALMYQIAWFKYFSLFLGNTTYAQATVLATFMGGLAIGAWLWGRRADRSKNPLAVFAWLEIAIAYVLFSVSLYT
jgi:predicted MFS family arabinose efflux permease